MHVPHRAGDLDEPRACQSLRHGARLLDVRQGVALVEVLEQHVNPIAVLEEIQQPDEIRMVHARPDLQLARQKMFEVVLGSLETIDDLHGDKLRRLTTGVQDQLDLRIRSRS